MHADGGWFSFGSIGEAVRFLKVKRVTVEVGSCLLCRPFNRFGEVLMSRLNVRKPRTGCDACTVVEVVDTKSNYRRLLFRLLGK